MTFLTNKHIERRTFLRGMGASVALPFLDAMIPARSPWSETAKEQIGRASCRERV